MADDGQEGSKRPVGFLVAVVLAGVFFVTTVALAIVAVRLEGEKEDAGPRVEVEAAAGRFVDVFLQYDYREPDSLEAAAALTAPPFTEQFEAALPALEESVLANEHVSTGTVLDVFVAEVEEGSAIAIVVYDRVLDGLAGPRRETNRYLRLGLVEQGGQWRVNAVIDLNLAFAEPGSTTTTTG